MITRILFIFIALTTFSCQHKNCDEYREIYLQDKSSLVVTDKGPLVGSVLDMSGYDPVSSAKAEYYSMGMFFARIRKYIEVNDTLIKNKGSYAYIVKKKGFNILLEDICDEKGNLKIKIDTLYKR